MKLHDTHNNYEKSGRAHIIEPRAISLTSLTKPRRETSSSRIQWRKDFSQVRQKSLARQKQSILKD